MHTKALANVTQQGLLLQSSLQALQLLLIWELEVETLRSHFTQLLEQLLGCKSEHIRKFDSVEAFREVRILEEVLAAELITFTSLEKDV